MESKEFGLVTVFVREEKVFGRGPTVNINWAAIGSVPIEKAEAFVGDLTAAIDYAVGEELRLGIRQSDDRGHVCHACDGTGIVY